MQPIPHPLADILELARWAPSGDNTQPWRFEVVDAHRLIVRGFDTREHVVYDLDGHPSQIAHGALLETLAIAASAHGLRAEVTRHPDTPDTHPDYEVALVPDSAVAPDPLLPFVRQRSVQRRPMRTTPLTATEKQALQDAVGKLYTVRWFEGGAQRWRLARLMFNNARLRLTLPEAYPVHRDIIEWNARFSEDKVPDRALGLDAMTLKLMRWVMGSWQRVSFFNTWLAGHLIPRIEMDLLPGLLCAAHFALVAQRAPQTVDDYVAGGRAVQRFWLTAASLGLGFQPELTPLIFTRYIREGIPFSRHAGSQSRAHTLSEQLDAVLGEHLTRTVFMGRLGHAPLPAARSLRLPLQKLTRFDAN
ncbi:MAG: nitroreductase family protein [Thiobacillus sp.]|nr:nitroreductase family protein [Thiobacillus sp.]MDP2979593.1 nitroreductase family protein [Thiobacillus sp.]